MKALRKQIDKIKPNFEKGGKFYWLHSTFDAFETFLFAPDTVTKKGAHIRDAKDSKRTMIMVVIALLPVFLFGAWNIGYQRDVALDHFGYENALLLRFWVGFLKLLPLVIVSYVVCLGIEFAFAQFRGHEVNEGVLVTGFLIPLIMPINTPLWMVAVSTAFAIVIGKEVFGGTGMNILNPALTARVFLFFAYPQEMIGDKVWVNTGVDTISAATPLSYTSTTDLDVLQGQIPSLMEMFIGKIPGSIGETSTLAILIGAAILLLTGVGSWRIMFSFFAGGIVMGYLLNIIPTDINPYMELSPWTHICMGGFAFGGVFMITDPVSAAQTNKGKFYYGFLAGFLAILVRVLNPAYPEGVMMAILLMNVFAPLIDHYVVESNIKKRLKRYKAAEA